MTIVAPDFYRFGTRCVSDIEISGWTERSCSGTTIWIESEFEKECQSLTWTNAQELCKSHKARLPTLTEIENDCMHDSRCEDFDQEFRLIWSYNHDGTNLEHPIFFERYFS